MPMPVSCSSINNQCLNHIINFSTMHSLYTLSPIMASRSRNKWFMEPVIRFPVLVIITPFMQITSTIQTQAM